MPDSRHQNQKTIPDDILIVDDETSNLKLLAELLARGGYQMRLANNPT